MSQDTSFAGDGDLQSLSKTGAWRRHLPYLNMGNVENYILETIVRQDDVQSFTPITINQQAVDADGVRDDAGGLDLYLIDESALDPAASARGVAQVTRLWAPLWGDIVEYGEISFAMPDLRGMSYDPGSGAVTASYDDDRRGVTLTGGSVSTTAVDSSDGDFTAGTWTYKTSAAINWNDTEATILSKMRAVDTKIASVTKSGGRLRIEASSGSIVGWPELADFSLSGLTPAGEAVEAGARVEFAGTYRQAFYLYPEAYAVEKTAHGLSDGDNVLLLDTSAGYTSAAREVTVVDSDNFTVPSDVNLATYDVDEYSSYGFYYQRAKTIKIEMRHQFYFVGVTPGISTGADIPEVALVDHDYALFRALIDDPFERIDIQVSNLNRPYPGVYHRVVTSILPADLFD